MTTALTRITIYFKSIGKRQAVHPLPMGIMSLTVPLQQSPVAKLSRQGQWIYIWALWPGDWGYLPTCPLGAGKRSWCNTQKNSTFSRLTSASTICFRAWRGSEALWCRKWERVSSSRKKSFSLKPVYEKYKSNASTPKIGTLIWYLRTRSSRTSHIQGKISFDFLD